MDTADSEPYRCSCTCCSSSTHRKAPFVPKTCECSMTARLLNAHPEPYRAGRGRTRAYVLFDGRADADVIKAGHRRRPRAPSLGRYDPVQMGSQDALASRGEGGLWSKDIYAQKEEGRSRGIPAWLLAQCRIVSALEAWQVRLSREDLLAILLEALCRELLARGPQNEQLWAATAMHVQIICLICWPHVAATRAFALGTEEATGGGARCFIQLNACPCAACSKRNRFAPARGI